MPDHALREHRPHGGVWGSSAGDLHLIDLDHDTLTKLRRWSEVPHALRDCSKAAVLRLHMLGWTQERIGEALGVTQSTVHEDLSKTSEIKSSLIVR